jgi:hypothetical protein
VSELGGWGNGVFNGGAWLTIEGQRVDVHYRDLDVVEHERAEAEQGRFRIEPLLFHLAGIPSYLVVGELAINQVLHGILPRPNYPGALRQHAPPVWWGRAELGFDYARANYAQPGHVAQCAGLIAQATIQSAHAVLAARGEWATNEKTLLTRAGLDRLDGIITRLDPSPKGLLRAVDAARELCASALDDAS